MIKKAIQRGRSERRGVNPLQPEEQWVPKNVEPLTGTRCQTSCNGRTRTKLGAFFNIRPASSRILPRCAFISRVELMGELDRITVVDH